MALIDEGGLLKKRDVFDCRDICSRGLLFISDISPIHSLCHHHNILCVHIKSLVLCGKPRIIMRSRTTSIVIYEVICIHFLSLAPESIYL